MVEHNILESGRFDPALTGEQLDRIEKNIGAVMAAYSPTRRAALVLLARSSEEIKANLDGEEETALAFVELFESMVTMKHDLEQFAELLDAAIARSALVADWAGFGISDEGEQHTRTES